MKKPSEDKEKNTATRSPSKRRRPKSERELLVQQVADAKLAATKTAGDLARNLLGAINVRGLTQRHPLGSTGVAAFAGFVLAGPGSSPRKEGAKGPGGAHQSSSEGKAPASEPSLSTLLLTTGAEIAKDVLTPVLQDLLKGTSASRQKEPSSK